jgi:hypothetical protein
MDRFRKIGTSSIAVRPGEEFYRAELSEAFCRR